MNPRILKKLCKRIVEMGHPIAKGAFVIKFLLKVGLIQKSQMAFL